MSSRASREYTCRHARRTRSFRGISAGFLRNLAPKKQHESSGSVCLTMNASGDGATEKVQSLSDLELAVLICLVAEQHCIIEAEAEITRNVQEELQLAS